MSTIKADAITASTGTNTNIAVTGKGSGKVAIGDGTLLFPDADGSAGQYIKTDGSANLAFATLPAGGKLVQMVTSVETGNVTGTTTTPVDDTIPTSSEGNALTSLDLAITPTSATNKLVILITLFANGTTANSYVITSLFQDSGSAAIAAKDTRDMNGGSFDITMQHIMDAGTTSATTFKIRLGANSGRASINGETSRRMGGVASSRMTIMEISA